MTQSALETLEADEQIEKRAAWEAFEFTVLSDGEIEVVNESHGNAEEHTYTVSVDGDTPSECTCPAFEYQEGACKHMVAVAIRGPVLKAASEFTQAPVRTDGGRSGQETCPNGDPRCDGPDGDELPCFACYEMPGGR